MKECLIFKIYVIGTRNIDTLNLKVIILHNELKSSLAKSCNTKLTQVALMFLKIAISDIHFLFVEGVQMKHWINGLPHAKMDDKQSTLSR